MLEICRSDEGVRDLPIPFSNRACQIREYGNRLEPLCRPGPDRCRIERVADDSRTAFDHHCGRIGDGDRGRQILERHHASHGRAERLVVSAGRQDGIHSGGYAEIALDFGQRHEQGPDFGLAWLERELSELFARQKRSDRQAHRPRDLVLAPK